mgnify:CR=1 FL=1
MKKVNTFLKLMTITILLIFTLQVVSQAKNSRNINFDDMTSTAGKTEIITNFDWKKDVDNSIGSITIEDEGKRVQMTGNETLPGKNAIYIIPENHQEQNLTFDYNIDYGDSFNAAGVLLKVKEENGMLKGYMLSFNNPVAGDSMDWYGAAYNQLGAIWTFSYRLNDNSNNIIDKNLVKAIDLPISGRISVKSTQDQIVLTGDSINETIDTTGNAESGDGFGFFTDHYSHGCDQIGNFALTNFALKTVDLIPHDFIVDPNGGVWNNSSDVSKIQGIYKDTVQVPLPTRDGYTFVKWTQIGDSGTMSSLTDDAVYTFGENEDIDDKIVAEWIRIVGDKTSNFEEGKVKLNDIVTYTITLKNEGTVDGKAIIKDDAPEGTNFVENSIKLNDSETQYKLSDLNNGIEVDVPQGGETKLTFDVQVNDLNDGDLVTNKANYQDITVQDKETSAETNEVDLTYVEPIISAKKEATTENGNNYVTTGETIQYKITVQNEGGLAKDVIVKDIIPEGTTFKTGSIKINGKDTTYTQEDLENGIQTTVQNDFNREDLNTKSILDLIPLVRMNILKTNVLPGETILTFEVTVDNQKDENEIKNVAQVDDNPKNEVDFVYRKPIISAEKGMKTENNLNYVVSKEKIEYNITVKNSGSTDKEVTIQDSIPEGTTFVDGSIKIDGEKTEYTQENLEKGIEIKASEKHIKDNNTDNIDDTKKPNTIDNTANTREPTTLDNADDIKKPESLDKTVDANKLQALDNASDTNEIKSSDNASDTNEIKSSDNTRDTNEIKILDNTDDTNEIESSEDLPKNVTDDELNITDNNTIENETEADNSKKDTNKDANLQANEEPGKTTLTFEVTVNELQKDSETKTIENVAKVDGENTNKTSIEALPFNMKIDEKIAGFNVNGSTKSARDTKLAKTEIDMRKSSPTPQVIANIKINVTNSGKIEGSSVIEATIPEGFSLSNTTSTQWTTKDANTVTTKTDNIKPGESKELSLDVKWNNNENNFGQRNTKAQIIETSNETKTAETTTTDNQSEANMIIGIVTGKYDNLIIFTIIGIIALAAIIGEVVIIKKYIL